MKMISFIKSYFINRVHKDVLEPLVKLEPADLW